MIAQKTFAYEYGQRVVTASGFRGVVESRYQTHDRYPTYVVASFDGERECIVSEYHLAPIPTPVDTGMQHGPALDELEDENCTLWFRSPNGSWTTLGFADTASAYDHYRAIGRGAHSAFHTINLCDENEHIIRELWPFPDSDIMYPPISGGSQDADDTAVETYNLHAANGRHIRKATRVRFADGQSIAFTERLSKREAIRQALIERQRQEGPTHDA